jgi:hypothetical protein
MTNTTRGADLPTSLVHAPRLVVPFVLVALYVGQCLWFIGTQSLTYDEPTHVLTGLDAWRHGRFDRWNDQPPLARLLLTLPLVGDTWELTPLERPLDGAFWTISVHPGTERLAWHTRPVNVALGVALGCLLWAATRRMFSEKGANLALSLFAFSPPIIAHFSLATVDGSATLLLFAVALAVVGWRRRPFWRATVGVGAVLGFLLISKFSMPPLVLLALGIMVATPAAGRLAERLAKAATALIAAFFIVWSAYFFHVGPVTFLNGSLSESYAAADTIILPVAIPVNVRLWVPAPEYVTAFGAVAQHSVRGHPAFLMGEIKWGGGWRAYFPLVAFFKWPIIVWATAATAILGLLRGRMPCTPELAVMLLFPALFFALAMTSNLDIGDRYILPVYPFVLLLCGAAAVSWPRPCSTLAILAIVAALQAVDALRYAPDYLSYFNVFVRPDDSYRVLSDSNLDWGQGLIALRDYEHGHPTEQIRLAYFGSVDPREYGIRAISLGQGERPSGIVVISATHLSGQYLANPETYHWLLQYPRKAILNHTLHVFEVSGEEHR